MSNWKSRGIWQIIYLQDRVGNCPFEIWFLKKLSKIEQLIVRAAINEYLVAILSDNLISPAIKPIGSGLFEFRISMSRSEIVRLAKQAGISHGGQSKVLIRVFFTLGRNRTVVIIGGYNKLRHPKKGAQQLSIKHAQRQLKEGKSQN